MDVYAFGLKFLCPNARETEQALNNLQEILTQYYAPLKFEVNWLRLPTEFGYAVYVFLAGQGAEIFNVALCAKRVENSFTGVGEQDAKNPLRVTEVVPLHLHLSHPEMQEMYTNTGTVLIKFAKNYIPPFEGHVD